MYAGYVTMKQISNATGTPLSTLWSMFKEGYLRPAIASTGRGQEHYFHETAIAQVERAVRIRQQLGDGAAAREALRELAENPQATFFKLGPADAAMELSLS
jgi:hypothetical protein